MKVQYVFGILQSSGTLNFENLLSDFFKEEAVRILNEAMQILQEEHLGYERYERSEGKSGYRNGTHPKTIMTKFGEITLSIPESRDGFYPEALIRKYSRRSPQINDYIKDTVIAGLSTRKMTTHLRKFYSKLISPQGVSDVVSGYDERIDEFHNRRFEGRYILLYFDGFKASAKGFTGHQKRTVLAAYGVTKEFEEELIDFRVCSGETENNWKKFINNLYYRGLKCGKTYLLLHDGNEGLENSLSFVYGGKLKQRCVFHKCENVNKDIKDKKEHREEMMRDFSSIYRYSETVSEFKERFSQFTDKWSEKEPDAVDTAKRDIDCTLTYFKIKNRRFSAEELPKNTSEDEFRKKIIRYIKTNNKIERFFREIRRRSKLINGFENDRSIERFFYHLVMYIKERREDIY